MSVHAFSCLDGHTCGNPVRLVTGGAPLLKGTTMSERRQDFMARPRLDPPALMFEPRGHDVMSGSMLYPPTRADCDIGILFIEVSGCLPMCGHGTIGTVTMAVENGLVPSATTGELALDTPAGRIVARYRAGRPLRRKRAHHQCRVVPGGRATSRSMCRAWASSPSIFPMAATSTPSSSRRRTSPASKRCRPASAAAIRRSCESC